jgi:hypothetical protein
MCIVILKLYFYPQDHNCVRELRSLIHSQQQKIADFQQAVAEQRFQINEQKRELQLLKVTTIVILLKMCYYKIKLGDIYTM